MDSIFLTTPEFLSSSASSSALSKETNWDSMLSIAKSIS